MHKIYEYYNPLDLKDFSFREVEGNSVKECIDYYFSTEEEPLDAYNVRVILNGEKVVKPTNKRRIKNNSTIIIVYQPCFSVIPVFLVSLAVSAAVVLIGSRFLKKPINQQELPQADPTYVLTAQTNKLKYGDFVPDAYGRNRIYPNLLHSYTKYESVSIMTLFQLFIVSKGKFHITDFFLGDTRISSFHDVTVQVIQQGQNLTASTYDYSYRESPEVDNVEVLGPNEPGYTFIGPFIPTNRDQQCSRIEADLSYPYGLYQQNSSGNLINAVATVLVEYQYIDENDVASGAWITAFDHTERAATTTPIARTRALNITPGRIQVRIRRTNEKAQSATTQDRVFWQKLRVKQNFGGTANIFGNSTVIALKMVASNQLNDTIAHKFNIICTRIPETNVVNQLNIGFAGAGSRSIAAAFLDVLLNRANIGDSSAGEFLHIDINAIKELHSETEGKGKYFDYVFNQQSTVWDALQTICVPARAVPVYDGTKVTIVSDKVRDLPLSVFNSDEMTDFSITTQALGYKDYDSTEVRYTDGVSGVEKSIVVSVTNRRTNSERIDAYGITDITEAAKFGCYREQVRRLQNQSGSFTTGYSGALRFYGDLIGIGVINLYSNTYHGTLLKQIGGSLGTIPSGYMRFEVSTDMQWETRDSVNLYIYVKRDNGTAAGPYTARRPLSITDQSLQNKYVDIAFESAESFADVESRINPTFIAASGEADIKYGLVTSVEDEGTREKVKISFVNYNDLVYQYENIATIADNTTYYYPSNPTILQRPRNVIVERENDRFMVIKWDAVHGADSYRLNWTNKSNIGTGATVTREFLRIARSDMMEPNPTITVRGLIGSSTVGPIYSWTGRPWTTVPTFPESVQPAEITKNGISMEWANVPVADYYYLTINVWENSTPVGGTHPRLIQTSFPRAIYTPELKRAHQAIYPSVPLPRTFSFRIRSVLVTNGTESVSGYTDIPVQLPTFGTPGLQGFSLINATDTEVLYEIRWISPSGTAQIRGYKAQMSTQSGFTPADALIFYDGVGLSTTVVIPLTNGSHTARYIKVGAYDVWSDTTVSYSPDQLTIPAYTAPTT